MASLSHNDVLTLSGIMVSETLVGSYTGNFLKVMMIVSIQVISSGDK